MQKLCCVRTRQQFSASLDYFVTSLPPYLHQFSTISGGNCITQQLLEHIIAVVLDADTATNEPDNVYCLAAAELGWTLPGDTMIVTEADIDNLTLTVANGSAVRVTPANKCRLLKLNEFWMAQTEPRDWTGYTIDNYEDFLAGVCAVPPPASDARSIATAVAASIADGAPDPLDFARAAVTAATAARPTSTPADELIKGLKRSVDDYKPFKEARNWNQWHRHLIATGRQHGITNVFDDTYAPVPTDARQVDLWDEIQKFAFSVFTATLIESSSADIVRRYSNLRTTSFGNAQNLYKDLKEHFTEGVHGKARIESLEKDIDELCLDNKWNKTVVSFVNVFLIY